MNAQYFFETGMYFIKNDNYKDALACFEEAVKLQPDFADASFGVGVCKIKFGDIVKGKDSLLKAARLGCKEAQLFLDNSENNINKTSFHKDESVVANYNTKTSDRMLSDGRDAKVESQPPLPLSFFETGMAFIDNENYKDALACFEEAVRLQPDFADANFGVGVCKIKLGDIANGENLVLKAARLGCKEAKIYLGNFDNNIKDTNLHSDKSTVNNNKPRTNDGIFSNNMDAKVNTQSPLLQNQAAESYAFPLATRWPRFFARTFDMWWEIFIISTILRMTLPLYFPKFARWIHSPGATQLFGILCLPIGLILDALIYEFFGNTPGKAFLGLKVGTIYNRSLNFSQYLTRNFSMWLRGLALYLPLINCFAMAYQASRLGKGQQASYDELTEHRVFRTQIGLMRKVIFYVIFVCILLFISILNTKQNFNQQSASVNDFSKKYSWTNPTTQVKVNIDAQWNNSFEQNSAKQPIYVFSERTGRAVVIFAVEYIRGYSLQDYIKAFQANEYSHMRFFDDGRYFEKDGDQKWQGIGAMNDSTSTRLEVTVLKIGTAFWRVVAMQEMPYDRSNNLVAQLKTALWSTVK